MSKHTPGPWKCVQIAQNENRSCFAVQQRSSPGAFICWPKPDVCTTSEENEANARLIAAAPELLEAAVIALFVLANMTLVKTVDDGGEGERMFAKAQALLLAALEKAEGRDE